MSELDEKDGKNGSELEELYAHKFLEKHGETLTVRELREVLRKIDIVRGRGVAWRVDAICVFTGTPVNWNLSS